MTSLIKYYLIIINIVTMTLYGIDKARAADGARRISEATLLIFPLLGGTVGGILGMKLFHHKVNKPKFSRGLWLILILQLLCVAALGVRYGLIAI